MRLNLYTHARTHTSPPLPLHRLHFYDWIDFDIAPPFPSFDIVIPTLLVSTRSMMVYFRLYGSYGVLVWFGLSSFG